jgi:hypothetical protein
MVKKAAFLPLALLLLSACEFFTASEFPAYLAQTEIGIDLNDQVEALLAGRTNPLRGDLFVLRNGAGEDFACVLLFVDYTPDRTLFVLTPDGRLLQRNEPELDGLHLTAADGKLVIGRVAYDPTSFAFADDLSTLIQLGDGWKPAVSDGTDNYVFDVTWNTMLNYWQYSSAWAFNATPLTMNLGTANYELSRVFKDPQALNAEVILVLRTSEADSESAVVVRTPQTIYKTGGLTNLVDTYPHTILSKDKLDPRRTYYTRKGIAAASYDGLVTLYSLNGIPLSSLRLDQRKDFRLAFNLEGTHFWCFNLDDRLLFRGRTGW